jgi:hypothetical protein
MPKGSQMRPWKICRGLVLGLPIAMLTGSVPVLAQSPSGEGLAEGTEAYGSPNGESPGAGLSDQDLPDQDLSDQDLPDQNLSDQDLSDQDLPDGDLPSGNL